MLILLPILEIVSYKKFERNDYTRVPNSSIFDAPVQSHAWPVKIKWPSCRYDFLGINLSGALALQIGSELTNISACLTRFRKMLMNILMMP